tara:strand:+ start:1985 stop:2452 length:468 start_codon:yes stop_codon:yes gene_type:complete
MNAINIILILLIVSSCFCLCISSIILIKVIKYYKENSKIIIKKYNDYIIQKRKVNKSMTQKYKLIVEGLASFQILYDKEKETFNDLNNLIQYVGSHTIGFSGYVDIIKEVVPAVIDNTWDWVKDNKLETAEITAEVLFVPGYIPSKVIGWLVSIW